MMADFAPLHPDKPGQISPRNIDTRRYRVRVACGPFAAEAEFTAWPWGEVFAWVTGTVSGPICKNAELKDWVKAGALEELR